MPPELLELLLRLLVASALGCIIGIERNMHGRPAGLRTHLMVSLGAATFMILSIKLPGLGAHLVPGQVLNQDPARIAAQIVTGIGFLGAGVIIKDGLSVRGLTTAACLWVTAAIGMAAGAGFFLVAGTTTAISLVGLVLLPYLERFYQKDSYYVLRLVLPNQVDLAQLTEFIRRPNMPVLHYDFERNYETGLTHVRYNINVRQKKLSYKLMGRIIHDLENSDIPIRSVKWTLP